MRFSFIMTWWLVISSLGLPPSARSAGAESAILQGSVRDYNGAAYVCDSCAVTVTSPGFRKTTILDDRGTFRMELPPGLYSITTEIPRTYPLKRAAFRLNAGETVTLDLVPRLRILGIETEITDEGMRDSVHQAKPLQHEELDLDPQGRMRAILEFERREARRKTVTYGEAVLTYDSVTVYADKIAYNSASKRLEATGDRVVVDSGGTRRITKRAKLRLSRDAICIEYSSR